VNLTDIPQLARNVDRLRQILTLLSRYGLAAGIDRLNLRFARGLIHSRAGDDLAALGMAGRVRLALCELGPTFVKLGQMLSTRADLVGPALAEELTALQADVPADPPALVRQTVEKEFGRTVEELFGEFDLMPLASASIGQVHRARLHDGRDVVVKVQHAGIEAVVRTDLEILLGLADLAERYLPEFKPYRPRETVSEFQRTMLRELDFNRERRNLERFAALFARNPAVRFPRPLPGLCSARVLTMDRLDGFKLSDTTRLADSGIDHEEYARKGAGVFLEMIFRDGFYHADPHPGNLLVLPGGVIGVLDCGMVGRLDEQTREAVEEMLQAIVRHDAEGLTDLLVRLGTLPDVVDMPGLRSDVADYLAYYSVQSLAEFDLGGALRELVELVRRYQILLPAQLALLLKVLVMLEGTSRLLSPTFNLTELIRPYQAEMLRRRLSPLRQWRRFRRVWREWSYLGELLPEAVRNLLQHARSGRIEVHIEHHRLIPLVDRAVLAVLSSALFLGSSLLLGLRAPPAVYDVSLGGVIGCVLAVAMGGWLLVRMRGG
jgi:ubiquinone biosynthesis protein